MERDRQVAPGTRQRDRERDKAPKSKFDGQSVGLVHCFSSMAFDSKRHAATTVNRLLTCQSQFFGYGMCVDHLVLVVMDKPHVVVVIIVKKRDDDE